MILDDEFFKELKPTVPCQKVIEDFNYNNTEEEIIESTTLQQFYSNETILITGGTGFLGKVLIEKLLRCCPDVSRIYLIIRQKKNKNSDERLKDLLQDSVFGRIRSEMSELSSKIVAISGDCSSPNLGLSSSDIDLLLDEVTIVFNVAATVRFDEKLKAAVNMNLKSANSMLDLCKNMHKLKSIIHVSTAYSNCFSPKIEEKFYDYPMKYEEILKLVDCMSDDTLDFITPQIINSWPNTYTFTKAMAEDLIRNKNKNLPMGIFRPGIVSSTAYEPFPGWTDNFNGPMGVTASCASGMMRVIPSDSMKVANFIPVDLTVNALIACAWDVATQKDRRDEDMLIYNYTSTVEAPIVLDEFTRNLVKNANEYPLEAAVWCTNLIMCKNKYLYTLLTFFLHIIPAFVIDTATRFAGQKPRMQRMYDRVHKLTRLIAPFIAQEWDFKNDNVLKLWSRLDAHDKQLFQFSMQNFDWPQYLVDFIKGIRIYLLNESIDTLEASRIKMRRFYHMQQLLILSIVLLVCWFIWSLYSAIF